MYDLKGVQTGGGNKYFITFTDDNIKNFCYIYLLKNKMKQQRNLFFLKKVEKKEN